MSEIENKIKQDRGYLTMRTDANENHAQEWKLPPSLEVDKDRIARFVLEQQIKAVGVNLPEPKTVGPIKSDVGRSTGSIRTDDKSFVDLGPVGDFEWNKPFSYGAWIKRESAGGSPMARMDESNEYRGWDLHLVDGRPTVHLIHQWPQNAIKVIAKEPIPKGEWAHVFATYDGSAKASGVRLYVNGQVVPFSVEQDHLTDKIRSQVNLHIGRRSGMGALFTGELDDPALYSRALSPAEVKQLSDVSPARVLLNIPLERRSSEQRKTITREWLSLNFPMFKAVSNDLVKVEKDKQSLEAKIPTVMVMQESPQPHDMFVRTRGLYDHHGERVSAVTPAFLPPFAGEVAVSQKVEPPVKYDWHTTSELQAAEEARRAKIKELKLPPEYENTIAGNPIPLFDSYTITHAKPVSSMPIAQNRLTLAKWLVSPENPLTARVTVNRMWERLFGTGIVETSEDFGTRSSFPSHPELLDWLATELIAKKWDLKAIWKEMVMSATYRQSSSITPKKLTADPTNRLLSRGPRFRLQAEVIRDQAMCAGGFLTELIGGPSVHPYQPKGIWDETAGLNGNLRNYKNDSGPNLHRRSLYTIWKRTAPPPDMVLFDTPSREICSVRRPRTDTPLQALTLLNDVTYVEAARGLAQRILKEGGSTAATRIDLAFRLLLCRSPLPEETKILSAAIERETIRYRKDRKAALALLNFGDLPIDTEYNAPELAAYTLVASTVLNMDETVTKR